jgi:hypothetical protein
MDGERYDLYLGSLKVGTVTQTASDLLGKPVRVATLPSPLRRPGRCLHGRPMETTAGEHPNPDELGVRPANRVREAQWRRWAATSPTT